MENLYRNHNYGKQTTIGTIQHLKNPSLLEIRNYFNKYYVPNNMGIIIAGDFDRQHQDQAPRAVHNLPATQESNHEVSRRAAVIATWSRPGPPPERGSSVTGSPASAHTVAVTDVRSASRS